MTKLDQTKDMLGGASAVDGGTLPGSGRDALATLRQLAGFHLAYGQETNAEKFLQIALWLDPKDGESIRLMAHVKARAGHAGEAAKLLLKANDSDDVSVKGGDLKAVGLALLRTKQKSLGLKFLNKLQLPKKR